MRKSSPPAPPPGSVRLGDLARTEPISRTFGADRGTPLDRYYYIDDFLKRHATDIKGRALEIGEDAYTSRLGGTQVTRLEILDVDAGNPKATVVGDLTACDHIPSENFDCIILTQTLHMVFDLQTVLANIHRLLTPGGVVLATVPGISQIDAGSGRDTWFWYMTPHCARLFFEQRFAPHRVDIAGCGNVLAATALLQGLDLEEMDRADLDVRDPLYPVITGIRAEKTA